MSESNQEGYQTLGWIINESEYGLFLVVADEHIQEEIVEVYRQGMIGVYDYRQNPGEYSFQKLKEWITSLPKMQTFFMINFQFAVQSEQDFKRLNFSRDMLAGLGKNLIFFTTPYGDDSLSTGAYDFYSFLKMRIIFHDYVAEEKRSSPEFSPVIENDQQEKEWGPEQTKQKLNETYILVKQAKEAYDKAKYRESINLLLQAKEIRERILGSEHPEMATIYNELSEAYEKLGIYAMAEESCRKTLEIRKKAFGEDHPDVAAGYNDLALVKEKQGKYIEAEELYRKSLSIRENVLGENHPDTAESYNNLAALYVRQGKYKEAELLYEKALSICEKVLGKDHHNTKTIYQNLLSIQKYRETKE